MRSEDKIREIRRRLDRIILGVQENKSTCELDKLMNEIEIRRKRKIQLFIKNDEPIHPLKR